MKRRKILIESSHKTPYIHFDEGLIEIKGRSILEDSTEFYMPLIKWVEEYIKNPVKFTLIKLTIEYSNSNSNKFLYRLIKLFENCYLEGNEMGLEWYYEEDDDSIKDLGQDLKSLSKLPISLIPIK
ncbi:MAG: DUF1987 domain-containing protein [Bacteroidales bacterium]|nr:DUF1987 domain-containing protein [Bacteroidales bacterium]